MRRNSLIAFISLAAALLVGCDDSTSLDLSPRLVTGSVTLAAPAVPGNEDLPTALDVTGDGIGGVFGARFPERVADATEWDFAVRIRDGKLVLVPAGVILSESRAAITKPLTGETFEGVREAPGQSTFVSDSAVVLVEDAVYVARSRESLSIYGIPCSQFAKLSPSDVDIATGRVVLDIVTNEGCADPRLVPE